MSLGQPEGNLLNEQRSSDIRQSLTLINAPGSTDSLRHPLWRQPTFEGHAKAIKCTHGGSQARPPLPFSGTINYDITYKKGGLDLTAFAGANWGNNPDKGKSMPHIVHCDDVKRLSER